MKTRIFSKKVCFFSLLFSLVFSSLVLTVPAAMAQDLPGEGQEAPFQVYFPSVTTSNNIVKNGGFEQGNTDWTTYSGKGGEIITQDAANAHMGEYFARMGGSGGYSNSGLSQMMEIPYGYNHLNFWYKIHSREHDCNHDKVMLLVNGDRAWSKPLCRTFNTEGYEPFSIDLTTYSGTLSILEFRVFTNHTIASYFSIDTLSIDSQPLGDMVNTSPGGVTLPD